MRDTDIAIVKIEGKGLPYAQLARRNSAELGQTVIAIGNAYGYEHTVTRGIISALHRNVQVSDEQKYNDLIQSDASINPGNSGGPLLDYSGDVIGIVSGIINPTEDRVFVGLGFAVPIPRAGGVTGAPF